MPDETAEQIYTFYADAEGVVAISCPRCNTQKKVEASKFKKGDKLLTVTCLCGFKFKSHLELRQAPRKRVRLEGEYRHLDTDETDDIRLDDLSLTGLRFTVAGSHPARKGDMVEVTFTLDTPLQPVITRRVEVTGVEGRVVHGKFVQGPSRDADLGFYLMI